MKTCQRFARIRYGFEQDIRFLTDYAERKAGTAPAKSSKKHAYTVRRNMARALSKHYERCPECG
ncbi:hypothetical protein ACIRQP_40015 [Streptomyces sp. NPDC102274]|uniref:hypothetical protein n=1 Tax=Streptomyces sp. NPDC102274 TaxID=3366151 RepID=UPI0037FBA558